MNAPEQDKLDLVDSKVDDLNVRVAVIDTRMKIGFAVLGALVASPKLGGPAVSDAVTALLQLL